MANSGRSWQRLSPALGGPSGRGGSVMAGSGGRGGSVMTGFCGGPGDGSFCGNISSDEMERSAVGW